MFRHLIIGSGPHNLVLGIRLLAAAPGDRVAIVDAAHRVGGAWYTGTVFGVADVELGCHFLKNDPAGYRVLRGCGVNLAKMAAPPSLLVTRPRGTTGRNLAKNAFLYALGRIRGNPQHDMARTLHHVARARQRPRSGQSRPAHAEPFLYPTRGCAALITDLVDRFTAAGGELILGRRVSAINEHPTQVVCSVEAAELLTAEHAHVPRNHQITSFTRASHDDTDSVAAPSTTIFSEQLMLEIVGPRTRPFSFVDIAGDDSVNLVSDVGQWAAEPCDAQILAVSLRAPEATKINMVEASSAPARTEVELTELVEVVAASLRRCGLISRQASIRSFHLERYPIYVRSEHVRAHLAAIRFTRVHFHDTTDLIESLVSSRAHDSSSVTAP